MTIFLNIETCRRCRTEVALEWVPAVSHAGRTFAGTGQWRSQLVDGCCPACFENLTASSAAHQRELAAYLRLVRLGGGQKPYREFTFERFRVAPDNELAFRDARAFNPLRDNLYLWGACGIGKTHLAFAAARLSCDTGRSIEFLMPPKLMRSVRRKDPDEEQRAIDRLVRADVFVLDDLGIGQETAYARQIFQEILDGRTYDYRAGLIVTSKYSLSDLAAKLDDDAITSRLAGLCKIIEMRGPDARLDKKQAPEVPPPGGAFPDV